MATIDFKRCTLKIKDNGSNSITVVFGEGNVTWSEKYEYMYDKDRGLLDNVRRGDDVPLELSFNGRYEFIKGDSDVTVRDALTKYGGASTWASTDADACAPYAVDIEFEYTPLCTTAKKETILFPDFRVESIDPDPSGGTIAFAGKCNVVAPTITRTSQS